MRFNIAYGSVMGSHHHRSMKNNQDAYRYIEKDDIQVGVVCDGCGSCQFSEIGANYGASYFSSQLIKYGEALLDSEDPNFKLSDLITVVRSYMISDLSIKKLNNPEFTQSYLFTIVGFLRIKDKVCIFHEGDGYYEINGDPTLIDEQNQPSYIAYSVLGRVGKMHTHTFDVKDVQSFIVATDGMQHYLERGHETSEIFDQEFMFENPAILERYLRKLNAPSIKLKDGEIQKSGYQLFDDFTLIVGKL